MYFCNAWNQTPLFSAEVAAKIVVSSGMTKVISNRSVDGLVDDFLEAVGDSSGAISDEEGKLVNDLGEDLLLLLAGLFDP